MDAYTGDLVELKDSDIRLLKEFIKRAGNSLKKFRYFNKRDLKVIKSHLVTLIYSEAEGPVAYAHLDKEDENIWLGICVIEGKEGNGYGRLLMNALIDKARKLGLKKISLSVDIENIAAQILYKKYGFETDSKGKNVLFMNLNIL